MELWSKKNTEAYIHHIYNTGTVFINFGLIYRAGKITNRLHLTNYHEGKIVIFQLLSILLVRSCQKLTVKIGLGFFRFKLEFL